MRIRTQIALAAAVLFGVVYGGAIWLNHSRAGQDDTPPLQRTDTLVQRGEYVARLADCFACHTAPKGRPYAGGLAMQTPLGAVYSTNITPDQETGIGRYTYAQFRAAVQHGIRADGTPLYPAMPYPSYRIMPEEDIQALYAYFMHGVQPVSQRNADSTLPPVLNWRWPLAYWQLLFAPERTFTPAPQHDARINHGKYLVEGPGHCGACHTPRGVAYQEKALSDDGRHFLSGAVIDGWRAKSLRGEARGLASWTEEELRDFFRSGRTNTTAAFGAMAEVVEHSTQYWTEEDLAAMSAYLKTLTPSPDKNVPLPEREDTTTAMLKSGQYASRGAQLYAEHCIVCHRADGNGMARIFPALNRNSAVYANNAQSVIQITLEGGRMPHTRHDVMTFAMPGFRHLSNEDIAEVVNFIRNSWHNQAPLVRASDVADIRHFVDTKAPHIVPQPASGEHHE